MNGHNILPVLVEIKTDVDDGPGEGEEGTGTVIVPFDGENFVVEVTELVFSVGGVDDEEVLFVFLFEEGGDVFYFVAVDGFEAVCGIGHGDYSWRNVC